MLHARRLGIKKASCRGRSAAQGLVVYYDIFSLFFPLLSPIQTLSRSVILRINGSGRGHLLSLFVLDTGGALLNVYQLSLVFF